MAAEYNNIDITKLQTLDDFYTISQPMGSYSKAMANNLYGISHQGTKNPLPENRDHYGLTFFTRPQLCLNDRNLQNDRIFYNLLTDKPLSIQRFIRCCLDPRTVYYSGLSAPLIDEELAFIAVLTNNLKSISGWPDVVVDTFSSKQGLRKQVWGIVDSTTDIYEQFDLNCVFRNSKDEPIIQLFTIWCMYMSRVFEGMMSPYMDMIVNNEIDYNTRIYRLVLDESKRYVKKISATGAAFPINIPNGRFFDFQDDTNYNTQVRDIDITFRCFGACYNDPILVKEFNKTVGIFNSGMRTPKSRVNANGNRAGMGLNGPNLRFMEKIPINMLEMYNYRGYPYINPNTLELEWYIKSNSNYNKYVKESLTA